MLWLVLRNALPALKVDLFTTPTAGVAGGLENAILGTLLVVGLSLAFSVPVGVLGGVYLAEFDRGGPFGQICRLGVDLLVGVPSIVVGYFGYVTMVLGLGLGFSALAGGVALAVIALPYITRATELALRRVPVELREGSRALGASEATTLWRVTLRTALPGILTGVLLATAISLGETAPLIYTAGWSNFPPSALTHSPVGYLTYVIWTFIEEPFASAHALAYAAAFLLMVFILLVSVVARRLFGRSTLFGGRT
jgi:phosphate transport system permease protein